MSPRMKPLVKQEVEAAQPQPVEAALPQPKKRARKSWVPDHEVGSLTTMLNQLVKQRGDCDLASTSAGSTASNQAIELVDSPSPPPSIPAAQGTPSSIAGLDTFDGESLTEEDMEAANKYLVELGLGGDIDMDQANLVDRIDKDQAQEAFEESIGTALTTENVDTFTREMDKRLGRLSEEAASSQKQKEQQGTESSSIFGTEADPKVKQLQEWIAQGGFPVKSYTAALFRKQHKDDPAYAALDRSGAQVFRQNWLQDRIDKIIVVKKVEVQRWKKVDTTKGKFRCFGNIVTEFGGWQWKPGLRGAMTVAAKCTALGKPWVRRHPQSGLFIIVRIHYSFEFFKINI